VLSWGWRLGGFTDISRTLIFKGFHRAWKNKIKEHGENEFVAATKRFVKIASPNQTCHGDNFTYYTATNVIAVVKVRVVVVRIEIVIPTVLVCRSNINKTFCLGNEVIFSANSYFSLFTVMCCVSCFLFGPMGGKGVAAP